VAGTILKTRFVPPYQNQDVWLKQDLQQELNKSCRYPLTVVKAGPGAGKSMMLSHYFRQHHQESFAWYSLNKFDSDISLYVQNLIASLNYNRPYMGKQALDFLKNERGNPAKLRSALEILLNNLLEEFKQQKFFLIIDDFHLVKNNERLKTLTSYFVKNLPANFHLFISSRTQPQLPNFLNWQLKNRVNIIDDQKFHLNRLEVQDFFENQYDITLPEKELTRVSQLTEGWIMALDLIGRRLQCGQQIDQILSLETDSMEMLFEFLAREVLAELDENTIEFLIQTSIFQVLDVQLCDQYLDFTSSSREILEKLLNSNFFISKHGENQYRYHRLFQDFLQKKASCYNNLVELHRRAARTAEKVGFTGYAIYHYLEAREYDRSTLLILNSAEKLLQMGRIDTLQDFLQKLPEYYFDLYPELYLYQGDIYRLQSDFNGALNSYQEADKNIFSSKNPGKKARVLQRVARVYLDTVQPARADDYLQQALKLKGQVSPLQEAEFYQLLAENKINEGHYPEAENYLKEVRKLKEKPDEKGNLAGRVRLRTGRLQEALSLLQERTTRQTGENSVLSDHSSSQTVYEIFNRGSSNDHCSSIPRWHKETALLKSLIYSFLGRQQEAAESARKGLKLIQNFSSPFTEAVAYMRFGHACQLRGYSGLKEARHYYQRALDLVEDIGIERGRSEPLMGLALLEAFYGDRQLGESYAREGEKLTRRSGDEWLTGLLLISLGINQLQQGNLTDSRESFLEARTYSKHSYDVFTRIICNYWLTVIYHLEEEYVRSAVTASELLDMIQDNNQGEILRKPTLFTSRDPNRIVPALLAARERIEDSFAADRMLGELGYARLDRHPGYSLIIKAFGRGILYRGMEEITGDEWERMKARELFVFFLVNYRDLISRDKICATLWPDLPPEKAKKYFKVTLNSLKNTLEPNRQPRQNPYFIKREGRHYGFNRESSYNYDVEEFENLLFRARQEQVDSDSLDFYLEAVELYRDDFLDQDLYLEFTANERIRLRNKYLEAVENIISYCFRQKDYRVCIEYCNQALKIDRCWEPAYYHLISSYLKLDKRSMAVKTYQRCSQILLQELEVEPGSKIQKLQQEF